MDGNVASTSSAADQVECMSVVNQFFRNLDLRDYAGIVALMAPDGEWHRQGKVLKAGQMVIDTLNERSPTMVIVHMLTNMFCETKGDTATVHCYMTAYRHDDGKPVDGAAPLSPPASMARIESQMVRLQGKWRVKKSSSTPIFKA